MVSQLSLIGVGFLHHIDSVENDLAVVGIIELPIFQGEIACKSAGKDGQNTDAQFQHS